MTKTAPCTCVINAHVGFKNSTYIVADARSISVKKLLHGLHPFLSVRSVYLMLIYTAQLKLDKRFAGYEFE